VNSPFHYLWVLLTVLLTVYGQVVVKWQVLKAGSMPAAFNEKLIYLAKLTLNPWVLSVFFAAFLASLSWMAAMTKLPLSHAYPFTSLSFVLVLFLSAFFFQEPLTWPKLVGLALITAGIVLSSQG
jgi:multidrug transporter EmrE-like cation transporter